MKKAKNTIFIIIFRIVGIIILIQGIRMIGEGVYNYIDEHNQKDWVTTTAYVADISSEYSSSSIRHSSHVSYDITYQYEVDNEAYSDILYNRSQPMGIGDTIKVKYDPDAPDDSTDILKPSIHNLIVFLVFGTIMGILGFFLSGAWILIKKIRIKGKSEEEEVLPPEEYAKPKERQQSTIKLMMAIVRRIVVIVVVLGGIFFSIKLFPGTQAVGTERFKEVVSAAGYTTTDTSEELSQSWKVGSMLEEAVSLNDGNIRMDFVVMDTADSASALYNGMTLPVSNGETEEYDGMVHELYSTENEAVYVAKVRIRDIVLYVSAKTEYKAEVIDILEELGYWKE